MKKYYMVVSTFYPDNNPRSFRAFELFKEISKTKKVEVIIKDNGYDYSEIEKKYGAKITKITKITKIDNNKIKKNVPYSLIKVFKYFFADENIFQIRNYCRYMLKNINEDSILISVGLPISLHIASAIVKNKNKNIKLLVLDYGDPFYFSKYTKYATYFYFLEKWLLKKSDLILLPIESAIKSFEKFNLKLNFLISPQGVNLENFLITEYKENKVPTFAYAGIFYKELRNPKKLLDFLVNYSGEFKFIIFGVNTSMESLEILKPYLDSLGSRIELREKISRKECIYELSKMDFLINVDNLNQEQTPSKLIDYAITKRPIYSFNQNNFSEKVFLEFLNKNYREKKYIGLKEFDIKIIVKKLLKKIESLIEEGLKC